MLERYIGIIALCFVVRTLTEIYIVYFQKPRPHFPDESGKCRVCGKDLKK